MTPRFRRIAVVATLALLLLAVVFGSLDSLLRT
jgi:hypothetical protein